MPTLLVLTQTHNLWGGIEAWMADVFPFIEQQGWRVTWGLARGARFNDPDRFIAEHPYIRDHHVMDGRAGTSSARRRSINQVLAATRPDVVVPLAIGDALPVVFARRHAGSNAKVLCAVHSLHPGTLADIANWRSEIDMAAAVGGFSCKWLRRYFSDDPRRARQIRNGVLEAQRGPPPGLDGPLRIGHVGRLIESQKRAHDVPVIMGKLRGAGINASLLVAGDGLLRQAMQDALRGYQVDARFLGKMDRELVYRDVYSQLDCILLTSTDEGGGPLVILEAMHHAVVPVVSDFQGREAEGLLRDDVNCLTFPVGDTAAAARQAARLVTEPGLRDRLSAAAQASVRIAHSRQAMLDQWLAAANDLLELAPRPGREMPEPVAHGRLDRWGVPAPLADWLRLNARRHGRPVDGFAEWPGSICSDAGALRRVDNELASLQRESLAASGPSIDALTSHREP